MIAPAHSDPAGISRALHDDAHKDVSDPALTEHERRSLVEWHLDNARTFGPDADAREIFAEGLARWEASESYRRDLVALLAYPEALGPSRLEVEARLAPVIPLRRRRSA